MPTRKKAAAKVDNSIKQAQKWAQHLPNSAKTVVVKKHLDTLRVLTKEIKRLTY